MKAKPSRWSAVRAQQSPPRTRLTRPDFSGYQTASPRRPSPGAFLLRVLVKPALEHADVADVGAEHDVESVTRHRNQSDHAVNRDIAEHPRCDVPGRTEGAGLA